MSNVAIRVENLGKKYRISHQQKRERYTSLREVLVNRVKNIFSESPMASMSSEEFWALKEISFEIKQGEAVGIIGRNGAGKSTLLKLLSRITEPSSGKIELHGRVASLLEVGTGFHQELTGRENIYLNGSILGMTHGEIKTRFDEIVAFAEVEKFLDTPVKRYSSGMYMRLAFAVAAHLEPEILVVDEVLAVGDAEFQKKCLGKMQEVGSQGRTVIFVSHSMPVIMRLCSRVIVLAEGRIAADGSAERGAKLYLDASASLGGTERIWEDSPKTPGDEVARLRAVRVLDRDLKLNGTIDVNEQCYIEIEYEFLGGDFKPTAVFHLVNDLGVTLFSSADFNDRSWRKTSRSKGIVLSRCCIPAQFLAEGQFSVLAAVCSYNPDILHAIEPNAVSFHGVDRSEGNGVRGDYAGGNWPGAVRPMLQWEVKSR